VNSLSSFTPVEEMRNARSAHSRYSFQSVLRSGKIDFAKPIPAGTLIELAGWEHSVGNISIQITVSDYLEKMRGDNRLMMDITTFTLLAISDEGRPVLVKF
jgi:acyl-CoA hydrolase